jgi:hypothetical protein
MYRGAEWSAELAASAAADTTRKKWRIRDVVGNHLIIE